MSSQETQPSSDQPLATGLTPELMQWVSEQSAAGNTPAQMLSAMLAVGWSEELARKALNLPPPPANPPAAMPEPDLAAQPCTLDLGDRQVHLLASIDHPRVLVLGNLLSHDECQAIIDAAQPRLARSLTVATQSGGEEVNASRTSQGMFFQRGENEVVRRLEQRIARLLRWPVENGEGLQVLCYGPGAEYKPHHDYFTPGEPGTPSLLARGGQRVATVVIYLNEPEGGGGTTFPEIGLQVVPRRGNAVFFSYERPDPATRTLHGGAPVQAGEKWIATKWLREREFD
ncbi:2OG-Fe(II) oxygenase [Comamonas composti]|uniref:2OG-Fe(II) oxygenase n=1 Tax=Comamonas composti TaxID=408558 RepID=UPI0004215B90|nr:2OG-Fe(II) oxygenase [Comamonas composti]